MAGCVASLAMSSWVRATSVSTACSTRRSTSEGSQRSPPFPLGYALKAPDSFFGKFPLLFVVLAPAGDPRAELETVHRQISGDARRSVLSNECLELRKALLELFVELVPNPSNDQFNGKSYRGSACHCGIRFAGG